MNNNPLMRIGLLVSVLLLLALAAIGGSVVLGAGEYDSRAQQVVWGLVFAAFPLVAVVGVWVSETRPRLGLGLVIGSMSLMSLMMFWMAFVTVPVGLALIAFTIKRSGLPIWPIVRNRVPAA